VANFTGKDLTRTIWRRGDNVEIEVRNYGYRRNGSWGHLSRPVILRGYINEIETDRLHLRTDNGEWHEVTRGALVSIRPIRALVIDNAQLD